MSACLRLRHQRLVAAKICISCGGDTYLHVRCNWCHAAHLEAERLRKPAKGIYACTQCRQKGHNAATCAA